MKEYKIFLDLFAIERLKIRNFRRRAELHEKEQKEQRTKFRNFRNFRRREFQEFQEFSQIRVSGQKKNRNEAQKSLTRARKKIE